MSGLLNIGMNALNANSAALQTIGHNIANANTAGYTRQAVRLESALGHLGMGGVIGRGVHVAGVERVYSDFLSSQLNSTHAHQAAEASRAEKLGILEMNFPNGSAGLGMAIGDMLNSFSYVVAAPNDMTARTVVLTGAQNVADRLRATQTQFTDLAISTRSELEGKASQANTLLKNIAALNQQITRSQSSGQPSNDLLDRRQQYVLDLNEYIQTTQVMQDNGSLTVFVANQAVVQGSKAGAISVVADAQDASFSRLQLQNGSALLKLDDQIIAGGQLKGLLEFEQKDLSLAKNLIGRLAMTVGLAVNQQHMAGWDFEGNPGQAMFAVPALVAGLSVDGAQGHVQFTDSKKFNPSNYVVQMDSDGTEGQVIRQIDGHSTPFTVDPLVATNTIEIDGLSFKLTSSTLGAGQRMLFKPFADAAGSIQSLLTSPLSVAAASADPAAAIPADTPLPVNSGNAKALMDLRDAKLIDGGRLTEAYATSVSQIGLRVQSVQFSLEASQSIASNMSAQKAKVSSVNLDEEAARLMQFQQAYQASAKILQVAQRVMDTMLQELGR
jgi:flagellar hook-associated protein 1 FlgK